MTFRVSWDVAALVAAPTLLIFLSLLSVCTEIFCACVHLLTIVTTNRLDNTKWHSHQFGQLTFFPGQLAFSLGSIGCTSCWNITAISASYSPAGVKLRRAIFNWPLPWSSCEFYHTMANNIMLFMETWLTRLAGLLPEYMGWQGKGGWWEERRGSWKCVQCASLYYQQFKTVQNQRQSWEGSQRLTAATQWRWRISASRTCVRSGEDSPLISTCPVVFLCILLGVSLQQAQHCSLSETLWSINCWPGPLVVKLW